MDFSTFGQKFAGQPTGILQLMDDLGSAASQPDVIMLGGGNPSHIPAVQQAFRERMGRILDSENDFEALIGNYAGPAGDASFRESLAHLFQQEYGWPIAAENIALTNGSQTAFFLLFNLFAGRFPDGSRKKILLPLTPEYIGYEEVGLEANLFVAYKPEIQLLEDHLFKYRVNFGALQVDENVGAICVSRPTNPTGNVLTTAEINQLSDIAKQHNLPFIVDNAYGLPFPNIIFSDEQPTWEPHIVMCMSLSKLGLPGARTGIVIAHPEIIAALTSLNAIISLAPGNFGAGLAADLVRTGDIMRVSRDLIRPHYERKAWQAVEWLREALAGLDFYIHKPEGAIFLWIWFRGLPITSQALYDRLKEAGVLVIPGHHFFPGLEEPWAHKQECIRIKYAGDEAAVYEGIQRLGRVVKQTYQDADNQ